MDRFIVLLLFVHPAFAQPGKWMLQGQNVCFSAAASSSMEVFHSTVAGFIGGVKLVHKSGGVSCCDGCSLTNFGCTCDGHGVTNPFSTFVTLERNQIVYPTPSSDGVSFAGIDTVFGPSGYLQEGSAPTDGELQLRSPIYPVSIGQEFRVMYGEVLYDHSKEDNRGTTCVDVWFLHLDLTSKSLSEARAHAALVTNFTLTQQITERELQLALDANYTETLAKCQKVPVVAPELSIFDYCVASAMVVVVLFFCCMIRFTKTMAVELSQPLLAGAAGLRPAVYQQQPLQPNVYIQQPSGGMEQVQTLGLVAPVKGMAPTTLVPGPQGSRADRSTHASQDLLFAESVPVPSAPPH